MVKLVIDKGNSSIKYGIFDQEKLIAVDSTSHSDQRKLVSVIEQFSPELAIISSVTSDDDHSLILDRIAQTIILDSNTPLPFINEYETPETLGRDRIALAAGVTYLCPGRSALAIDAGTAITYDVVIDGNIYIGGNISPGMMMRFKALNAFTGRLPLVSSDDFRNLIGKTTHQAIASGVINGIVFEMEGYRRMVEQEWGITDCFITGGDSDFFAGKLKKPIFANQNLVLFGLNRILEYNA